MTKGTWGVAALLLRWRPRIVRYAVVNYAGSSGGVPHFNVSKNSCIRQETAIKKAKKLNEVTDRERRVGR